MNSLTAANFGAYFWELHHCDCYDWQSRLAQRAARGSWPAWIDLPTGSGKTVCLDIAVFALACQASWGVAKRTAPRRIFFCVNRRVIVDEAHQRAVRIAENIRDAEQDPSGSPVLARTAAALRRISGLDAGSAPPLDVLELRGGIYRDNRWARSATQPTIVCTTIDQLGSRLLFRGYGVSAGAAPIQAALIAYDSLVLLDEAHISRPFSQTLGFVRRYLDPERWAEREVGPHPMIAVRMTATPPEEVDDTDVIRLEAKDRDNAGLDARLRAAKPATLLSVANVVESAVAEAKSLAASSPVAVGIVVNRVATAKAIYELLRAEYPGAVVELVIGSMRPLDRDHQAERLRQIVGPDRPKITAETSFVVATQCLEVGADYDFDGLVTECASLDALRQRFGRLNRGGRAIAPRAVILIDRKLVKAEEQLVEGKPVDSIYGNALSRTWNWLTERAELRPVEPEAAAAPGRRRRTAQAASIERRCVDFGVDAFNATLAARGDEGAIPATLLSPSASSNAPMMLPSYVDIWSQTTPRPVPEPEVSLFIHGPLAGEPDVQVCWRSDLVADGELRREDWCDVVGLLPPTSAECMSVPISRLRRWLIEEPGYSDQGDVLEGPDQIPATGQGAKGTDKGKSQPIGSRVGVLWRGVRKSKLIELANELQPGDALVLPASAEGWNELGHMPHGSAIDVAELAFSTARDRAVLRVHPALKPQLPDTPCIAELLGRLADADARLPLSEIRQLLRQGAANTAADGHADLFRYLASPRWGLSCEMYPDGRGFVLTTRRRVGFAKGRFLPSVDDGEDEYSRTTRERPVTLSDHTDHVREEVIRAISALPLESLSPAYQLAAELHDLGKADERFQAMLRRTNRTDAWLLAGMAPVLIAKSDGVPRTIQQWREARERAGLPEGFRHEMLSVAIAERSAALPADHAHRDLILHLIAAHHGYARPFAPIVVDDDPPDVPYATGAELRGEDRRRLPAHRVDSGIAERFWVLARRYGWWGLAYLEAVLRLADQQASADEDAGVYEDSAPTAAPLGEAS